MDITKKKFFSPLKKKLTKDEPLLEMDSSSSPTKSNKSDVQRNNYVNIEQSRASPSCSDDEAPILMPKQHPPTKKSSFNKQQTQKLVQSEHYQLPPKDSHNDKEDYQPPLPPKQRHQQNTSRALVYDFIGSELQELRATLAQFHEHSSNKSSDSRIL
jgi:hypothetical protein